MNKQGILLAFEGLDGSGKETQTKLLEKRLKDMGLKVIRVDFPNYENEYSVFVKKYLNGEFKVELTPYVIATFYSLDRLGVYATVIKDYLDKGYIVICDRYVYSNLIYQGAKIEVLEERNRFFNWVLDFEYNICGLPKQVETFFINMPIDVSLQLIKQRDKRDIYESNERFLRDCYDNCIYVSKSYNFTNIDCVEDGNLLDRQDISNKIFNYVKKHLR